MIVNKLAIAKDGYIRVEKKDKDKEDKELMYPKEIDYTAIVEFDRNLPMKYLTVQAKCFLPSVFFDRVNFDFD